MVIRILCFVILLFLNLCALGQNTDIASGFHLGPGLIKPIEGYHGKLRFGFSMSGFYSRFIVARPIGYHIESGLGFSRTTDLSLPILEVYDPLAPKPTRSDMRFNYINLLETGLYFKFKGHKHHQPGEVVYMLGPKIRPFHYYYTSYVPTGYSNSENGDSEFQYLPNWGGHFSIQFETKAEKNFSYFWQLGVEYFAARSYQFQGSFGKTTPYDAGGDLFLFLHFGMNLWADPVEELSWAARRAIRKENNF